jgi:hypothetical protein
MHPGKVLLLLTWLSIAVAQSESWLQQLPPDRYYDPDVDVTSPTPLPRVPPSPYHMSDDNCPQQVWEADCWQQAGALRCT